MAASKKYYAYVVPETGARGVTDNWSACDRKVSGRSGARYRSFKTEHEARAWLTAGAAYEVHEKPKLPSGIYFDAGTGRGDGVEVSVTDEKGKDLLELVLAKEKINKHGKYLLVLSATNNHGELLGCKFALQIALKKKIKNATPHTVF